MLYTNGFQSFQVVLNQTRTISESTTKVFLAKSGQRRAHGLTVDIWTQKDGPEELHGRQRLRPGQARQEEAEGQKGRRGFEPWRLETCVRLPSLPKVLRLELQLEPAPKVRVWQGERVPVRQVWPEVSSQTGLTRFKSILLLGPKLDHFDMIFGWSIPIDNASNLVFWCHFLNKLEPWYAVYILQQ